MEFEDANWSPFQRINDLEQQLASAEEGIKQLKAMLAEAEYLLEDCWNQFAYRDEKERKDYTKPAKVLRRYSGRLSTLEALDSYLSEQGIIDDNGLFKWDEEGEGSGD